MENNPLILDKECFNTGTSIVNSVKSIGKTKIENVIQKSLGVVQEDGNFAFLIYLKSLKKEEGKVAEKIIEEIRILLKNKIKIMTHNNDVIEEFKNLGNNMNNMLLAKDLIERTLIYARYHAKALEK
ncbi:MAG: hypothetical protein CVT90_00085 [Candidatus Altiarchaeales archaeon HGW-Altiarchaeales-3]|nr:MAG: hypothetical protein CVT90_00085 [Candidatus Altiarchaeales archaeon HGW-Altiarchaeales-3]